MLNLRLIFARFIMKRFRYGLISQLDLKEFIQDILFSTSSEAVVQIVIPKLKEIFGFRRAQGTIFQIHFPISRNARLYYENIKVLLEKHGIDSNLEVRVYGKKPRGFLLIDIQQNAEVAYKIFRIILQEHFSLRADNEVEVYYNIDSPQLKEFKSK
jgi:hypothetical protein